MTKTNFEKLFSAKERGINAAKEIKSMNKKGKKMSYSARHKMYADEAAKSAYKKYGKKKK